MYYLRQGEFTAGSHWRSTLHLVFRVSELCACIKEVGGEPVESQVLLTADGKQMDPTELIGNYSVGTVSSDTHQSGIVGSH